MARRRIQRVVADSLAPLAPGVEVAAYRIAVEALTNTARHSGGRRCCLELTTDQRLRLAVTDDGQGLSSQNGEGVGIHTMRERARELGGRSPSGRPMARGCASWPSCPPWGVMMHGQRAGCRGPPNVP
jgi:signal transduction histidine kinase